MKKIHKFYYPRCFMDFAAVLARAGPAVPITLYCSECSHLALSHTPAQIITAGRDNDACLGVSY